MDKEFKCKDQRNLSPRLRAHTGLEQGVRHLIKVSKVFQDFLKYFRILQISMQTVQDPFSV